MTPRTVGTKHDEGRVVPIECKRNDDLSDLEIKDRCFLMILVKKGRATFSAYGRRAEAAAPCIVCFDETEDPVLVGKRGLRCDSVHSFQATLGSEMLKCWTEWKSGQPPIWLHPWVRHAVWRP